MVDPLLVTRDLFPIVARTNYLISNSLGAMPAATVESLASYAETWGTRGVRAWAEGWWMLSRDVGDLVGRVIGAGPGEVAMHLNVTTATATVLSCFDWKEPRNGVVVSDMNFPSLLYLYQGWRRQGLKMQELRSPDGVRLDVEQVIAAIDDTTRLVALDHVLFRSSFIQDAKAITEAAHAKGAFVLLDAFQSAGTVPLDVKDLDVDFATGGVLKWLCGGPGGCWLWVNPRLARSLEPSLTGWMAHPDPFDFDTGPMRFRHDAYRFTNGTPNVPGLMAAKPGLAIILDVGMDAIRRKSMHQTALLVELAEARGYRVTAPRKPEERGGTVAIDVPQGKAVCQELLARDIVVDFRPQAGIRVSPHFYTSDDECRAVIDEIASILETGAHERHLVQLPKYG